MLRALSRAGVALAIATAGVSGVAGAQVVVDKSTRTVSINQSAAYPADASFNGMLTGNLDTHLLGPSAQFLDYRFVFGTPTAFVGGGLTSTLQGPAAAIYIRSVGRDTEDIFFAGTGGGHDMYSTFLADNIFPLASTDFPYFLTPNTPYSISISAGIFLSQYGSGSYGSVVGSARLEGVDALDANRNFISSATFDNQGNGVFATTTPEPSSLALLGTGLLGLVPLARRRR